MNDSTKGVKKASLREYQAKEKAKIEKKAAAIALRIVKAAESARMKEERKVAILEAKRVAREEAKAKAREEAAVLRAQLAAKTKMEKSKALIGKASSVSPTANYLSDLLHRHPDVQQQELAADLGIASKGNILTMFKNGASKIPLKYIPVICNRLGEDPAPFLQIAINEYFPDLIEIVSLLKGEVYDEDELRIIRVWRRIKERETVELQEQKVEAIKKAAIEEGRLLSATEEKIARRLATRLNPDPKEMSKVANVLSSLIVVA